MQNIVALTVQVLRAELPSASIFAEIPNGADRPVLRVEEAGGPDQPSSLQPDRLTIFDVELTSWAETKEAAFDLMAAASAALHGAVRTNPVHAAGTLVRVVPGAPFYLPDEDWLANGRAGPRYEQSVRITAHA